MTQETSLRLYKKLEEKCLALEQEIKKLKDKYLELEKVIPAKIKINPLEFKNNQEFIEREKWISKQQSLFPGEILALRKKGNQLELLAHSNDEKIVLKEIDNLFEKKILSDKDEITFR